MTMLTLYCLEADQWPPAAVDHFMHSILLFGGLPVPVPSFLFSPSKPTSEKGFQVSLDLRQECRNRNPREHVEEASGHVG